MATVTPDEAAQFFRLMWEKCSSTSLNGRRLCAAPSPSEQPGQGVVALAAQRFQRNVQSELVAQLEAVGDRLLGPLHLHRHPIQRVRLDPFLNAGPENQLTRTGG